ncbi:PREDICTED: protein PXR1-like [Nelumbo nucifera]|uniref:Protein PXR1-like n=2 Tax=Nelumbo nucifera TaxID=4432 RepID=A0A822YUS8_NELNU|nr:PREDICTED: protein PXR1-like [Nelumbo nucifera]DAD36307.1 TPA_asm: hypothetical protein HUJ06_006947 [Nelumbo nucifera]
MASKPSIQSQEPTDEGRQDAQCTEHEIGNIVTEVATEMLKDLTEHKHERQTSNNSESSKEGKAIIESKNKVKELGKKDVQKEPDIKSHGVKPTKTKHKKGDEKKKKKKKEKGDNTDYSGRAAVEKKKKKKKKKKDDDDNTGYSSSSSSSSSESDDDTKCKNKGKSWLWMGVIGSILLLTGGLVVQQVDKMRFAKLLGGSQAQLNQEKAGQVPLILEEQRRKQSKAKHTDVPSSYRDVQIGPS